MVRAVLIQYGGENAAIIAIDDYGDILIDGDDKTIIDGLVEKIQTGIEIDEKLYAGDSFLDGVLIEYNLSSYGRAIEIDCSKVDYFSKYLEETTLGEKNKPFRWRIDDELNIHIRREFTNSATETISNDDLNKLDEYMSDGQWKDLANNVETLANGNEKPGIGKYLYDELGFNTTKSQLSSHLGAIFSYAKVWEFNGKMRGMTFRRISNNWSELVKKYYENAM